jgi:hypothetical protein
MVVGGSDRPHVLNLHLRRHAAGLELAEHHPTAYLVGKRGLNASVKGIDPSLKLLPRPPAAHDLVAVLVKLHAQPAFVMRIASETTIPLHTPPRVDYLFHENSGLIFR